MLEQQLQALMPQTSNHRCDCKTSFDICQQRQRITGSCRQQAEQPDCSRYLSNESCAESAHRVRSLPPPFADSVALSSTRRAPSWPGPLGRSQLVLARLHRSRPLQPADMPVACRRASRSTARSIPPAVCLGSPPLVREPHSHLHRRFQHGHSRITPRPLVSVRNRVCVDLEE